MTPVIHRARWIMVEPGHLVENGHIVVMDHRILDINNCVPKGTEGRIIDHGDGLLMPALVNAHTHIALSNAAMKESGSGFLKWVQCLIAARNHQNSEDANITVQKGIAALKASGTALVGEFGPHIPVAGAFHEAGLEAIIWMECLGNDKELPQLPPDTKGTRHAFAGHAPHTTSPELLKRVQKADIQLKRKFCLHLAESPEESAFLLNGKGVWADFMTRMGIDFSKWQSLGKRPVEMALGTKLLDRNTLAVHLLEINKKEMGALAETGAHICLCPRSNWILHRKLPDIEGFLKLGLQPALGTDSLASAPTLSLFDEMRFARERFPGINPDIILKMGTSNGAKALGYPDRGTLQPGSRASMIYVNLNPQDAKKVAENLLSAEHPELKPVFDDIQNGDHHAL